MNIEGFKMICEPVKEDLYDWLVEQFQEYYGKENVVAPGDYILCVGNCSAMLCAHLDTVHKKNPRKIIESDGKISSPQGIGGDDRCGVYAILSVLKNLEESGKKPFLFFSTDEEVGGASTKKAAVDVKNFIAPVGFMIELDRANSIDSVYYKCDNKEFKKWIDSYGFVEANGSFTDICTLCEAWDLAGVNLSVGYYNAHQTTEYVILSELQETIDKVTQIVSDAKDDRIFLFCKKKETVFAGGISIFYKDDEVATRSETNLYQYSTFTGKPLIKIPVLEFLNVEKVVGRALQVSYKGYLGWIPDHSVYLTYGANKNKK